MKYVWLVEDVYTDELENEFRTVEEVCSSLKKADDAMVVLGGMRLQTRRVEVDRMDFKPKDVHIWRAVRGKYWKEAHVERIDDRETRSVGCVERHNADGLNYRRISCFVEGRFEDDARRAADELFANHLQWIAGGTGAL